MPRSALCCLSAAGVMTLFPFVALARGASPYLPLNMSPQIERQIERVLILSDKPVMSRPIAAAAVLDALPTACRQEAVLCKSVRQYLRRYMEKLGLTQLGVEGASTDGAVVPVPNQRGMFSDSEWQASLSAYWQPSDYALVSLGGVAYDGDAVPSGSMVSLGFAFAQLDVGYREHWFSPFTHSAMLISTNARTLPSVTLSNYAPITSLGFQYEVFLAEMDYSERIISKGNPTSGRPRLAGLRIGIEPAPGWSLSANRIMQFGGGGRGGRSFNDFIHALLKPSQYDNTNENLDNDAEFGNQTAAWTSRFIFPGATPFAAYLEYAGEDSSYEGNYRLGNASLSIGLAFPRLWQRFDFTYEFSDWQNVWYVHGVFGDGLTTDGRVIGHWGADQRVLQDGVGAQTHMVRLGWEPQFGGLLQLRARSVANEDYSAPDYVRGYDVSLGYSRPFGGFTAGAEFTTGRDVFGENFSRLAGFVQFGSDWAGTGVDLDAPAKRPRGAELFLDTGANISQVQYRAGDRSPITKTSAEVAPHMGIGARRAVSDRSDLGVRLELDRIDDELLLAVRAVDYRYRFKNPLALGVFLGAARYDLSTPAYGYYMGAGMQWRDMLPGFDLGLDVRYMDKIARDKLLPDDPSRDPRPDEFYDVTGATLSISYKF